MTVFMGTRTNYLVSRYQWHSRASWLALMICVIIGWGAVGAPREMVPLGVVGGAGLVSKNGRKIGRRGVREVFYGCLFTFTGVFHADKGGTRAS